MLSALSFEALCGGVSEMDSMWILWFSKGNTSRSDGWNDLHVSDGWEELYK